MLKVESAVGKVMDSKVYVLSDDNSQDYYFIDIGDFTAVRRLLPNDARVRGVFLTHGHHDHIMGVNALKATHPECVVYASEECQKMLASAKANLSYYVETPMTYEGEVYILYDGSRVELFKNVYLDVLATPGHNPSCLSFLVQNYLFTGDSFIPGVKVVTNLPGGNKMMAQDSVNKIIELSKGKIIFQGISDGFE